MVGEVLFCMTGEVGLTAVVGFFIIEAPLVVVFTGEAALFMVVAGFVPGLGVRLTLIGGPTVVLFCNL